MNPGARLWRALAAGDDLPAPAVVWDDRLGGDRALLGSHLVPTTTRSSWWPCGKGREDCVRRLVDERDGCAAVCQDEDWRCATTVVSTSATLLHELRVERLLSAVRAGLKLIGAGPATLPGGATWALGSRRFGEALVRYYYAPRPEIAVLDSLAAVEPANSGVTAALVSAGMPDAEAAAVADERGLDLRPLPECATLTARGEVAFNLDAFLLHHRFPGVEEPAALLSDARRLVLDPVRQRAWLDRTLIEFPARMQLPLNLLVALARRPGSLVTRRTLYPEVWGEDYVDTDGARLGYREKVRQHRAALARLGELPISRKEGSDMVGGYRLDLNEESIAWWSDPPQQQTSQRKGR